MKTVLLALAAFALAAPALAGVAVDLTPRPEAHGKTITLGDLFDGVEGPAATVTVAPAAPAGGEAVLDAGRVQVIAHGAGLDWANPAGQSRIMVATSAEAAAPTPAQGSAPAQGSGRAKLGQANTPAARTARAAAKVAPPREPQVLVYARNLASGDLLTASDLVWSDSGDRAAALDAASDPTQAVGKVLRRPVRAGGFVLGADLTAARVIRRDDLVSVDYQVEGVSLTLEGKALSDACVGDTVQVLNPQSKKTIEAVAAGPDRAVVGPAAEALKAAAFNRPHNYAVR